MPLDKRQDAVTTTIDVIETITDIVDVVVTVWVPPGGQSADRHQYQQVAQPNLPNSAPVVHITPVEAAAVPAQTSSPASQQNSQDTTSNQANQAQEQKNQAQAAKNQAAQEQSIQTQNQANRAQEQANENKVAQNQAAQNQVAPAQSSPPPVAPASSPAAAAPVESPATSPAAQDTTSSDQTQTTSGGSCGQIGGSCTATNVTYFGGGMGACGWSNDTNSEDFFALAHDMMGTQSNGNPFCGRTAAIVYQGKTIHGTLTDKCMGCGLQSIDLSQHLFNQMFVESVGNYHDIEWHFTS
ncbi:hypothetical protein BDR22DRAFT_892307 [Usnea florida]